MHFFKRHAKTEGLTNRHLIVTIVTIEAIEAIETIEAIRDIIYDYRFLTSTSDLYSHIPLWNLNPS
jgi:hypothetical protein